MKDTLKIPRDTARRFILASFALAALYLISASMATAAVSTCTNIGTKPNGVDSYDIHMDLVTYEGPIISNSTDSRASMEDGQYKVRLRGWLYYQKSSTGDVENSKVLIYNHGHEAGRGEPCAIVKYFVPKGYVLFAPLRRGHFAKPPSPEKAGWTAIRSTGIHLDTYINKCLRTPAQAANGDRPHLNRETSYCRTDVLFSGEYDENAIETDYLVRQRIDIRDQIEYIKERNAIGTTGKLANPNRISLIGHSFGGSAVIIANGFDYGQNATVAVSPAEKSWGARNPYWEIELSAAMLSQARPIYMLQPKNGLSLEPTKTLFGIAIDKKYRSQAAIFPPAPWDSVCADQTPSCWDSEEGDVKPEWEQAHQTFIGDGDQLELWGPSARNFIFRHPRS